MKYLPWILVVVLGVSLFLSVRRGAVEPDVKVVVVDSIVHETLYYPRPVLVFRDVVRHDTVPLETVEHDTVSVIVPIESREYGDSTYRAWVSGYRASLDSIMVFPTTVYRIKTITQKAKKRPFGIGVQAGYGLPHGAYVGIGVSYNIVLW